MNTLLPKLLSTVVLTLASVSGLACAFVVACLEGLEIQLRVGMPILFLCFTVLFIRVIIGINHKH